MKMLREEKTSFIILLYSGCGLKSALHVYGNCISDGEIGWTRVSRGFGEYAQTNKEIETARIKIAKNNLIFLFTITCVLLPLRYTT